MCDLYCAHLVGLQDDGVAWCRTVLRGEQQVYLCWAHGSEGLYGSAKDTVAACSCRQSGRAVITAVCAALLAVLWAPSDALQGISAVDFTVTAC